MMQTYINHLEKKIGKYYNVQGIFFTFTTEYSTYHHKGQRVQDVCLRYQAAVSPSPLPHSPPFHCPLVYTANEILLIGSFSHKSCHPPNKAIKMFVCIIEGNVLHWVSFKQWCVHALHAFLKIHVHLGVWLPSTFSFKKKK